MLTLPHTDNVALTEPPPFGRQARSVFVYALVTALMIITPMMVFVPAALLHCALNVGRRAAVAVLLVSITLAAAWVLFVPGGSPDALPVAGSYLAAIALAVAIPSIASVTLVERNEPFGRVLLFMLLGSMVGLTATEAGSRAISGFSPYAAQIAQAEESTARFIQAYRDNGMPAEMVATAERWVGFTTFLLPAVILINILLIFVLSLLMLGRLRNWKAAVPTSRTLPGASYYFRYLSLPEWLLFAFVAGGITPLASGLLQKVAANVLTVVAFLYLLQGLAIFRFLLVAVGAGLVGTLFGWLLLAFLTITGVGPLMLAVAGLFDSFFDFRHFKKRKDDSHESHSD